MIHTKSAAVLFIDKYSLTYFSESESSLTFTYPVSSIKEMEVVDEQLFMKELSSFMQSNKILPATVMIILAEGVIYEKVFTLEDAGSTVDNGAVTVKNDTQDENKQDEAVNTQKIDPKNENNNEPSQIKQSLNTEDRVRLVQSFLDIVPFEELASKTYKADKGFKIIVTNKKLYETIVNTCLQAHFIVEGVVPVTIIPKDIIQDLQLSQEKAKIILKKFDVLRQYSLLEENSYALSKSAQMPHGITMSTKVSSVREYVLIGIFLTLLLTLGIIIYTTLLSPAKERKVASITQRITPTSIIVPSLIPTATFSSTPSAVLSKDTLKIQIAGGTGIQNEQLKQILLNDGYKNIVMKPNNIAAAGKATAIFPINLTAIIKEDIIKLLRNNFLTVTANEVASSEADIIINL